MTYAVKAVEELTKEGIDVELIDLRTIRPMDLPTIVESVKKTGRLVTVEEGTRRTRSAPKSPPASCSRPSTIWMRRF